MLPLIPVRIETPSEHLSQPLFFHIVYRISPSPLPPSLPSLHLPHPPYFFLSLAPPFVFAVPLNSFDRFFRCLRCCLDAFSIFVACPTLTNL